MKYIEIETISGLTAYVNIDKIEGLLFDSTNNQTIVLSEHNKYITNEPKDKIISKLWSPKEL